MKVRINPIKCQGYGVCTELAPNNFARDDWGLVQAKKADIETEDLPAVAQAVAQCPISAIRWTQEPIGVAAPNVQLDNRNSA
jgi:ferredoxin